MLSSLSLIWWRIGVDSENAILGVVGHGTAVFAGHFEGEEEVDAFFAL